MMARRGVATAFADIRADLTKFDVDLNQAKLRLIAVMRELDQLAVVNIRADISAASASLKAIQAEAKSAGTEATVKVGADTTEASTGLREVGVEAKALGALDPTVFVTAEARRAAEVLAGIEADAAALSGSTTIHVTADAAAAAAELASIEAEAAALSGGVATVHVESDIEAARARLAEIAAQARAVDGTPAVVKVGTVGAKEAEFDLAAVRQKAADVFGAVTIADLAAGATKITAIVSGVGIVMGGFALRAVGQMEQIRVGFQGILGPVAGSSFLNELKQFAAVTPFTLTQTTHAAQQLLAALGPEGKAQILPTLTTIGDIVSVTGGGPQQIDRVTLALTQMQGKGKVATQELNQLREALPGFNAIEPIAKGLGVTVPEAMKAVEQRTVDANVAIAAILEGMKQYPGAAGAMERQSLTLIGRLSTLKDVARFAAIDGFGSLNVAAKSTLEGVISTFTSGALQAPFKTLSDALGKLFSTLVPGIINSIGPLSTGFAAIIGPLADVLKVIIPAAAQLAPVLGELIGTLIKAIPLDVVVTLFDGLATGIAALNSVLQVLGTGGTGALVAFAAAAVALTTGGPLAAVVATVTALGAVIEIFNGNQRALQREVDDVAAALGREADKLLTTKDGLAQLAAQADITTEALVKTATLEGLGKDAKGLEDLFGRLGLSMGALVPIITAIREKGALKVESLVDPAAIASFGQLGDKLGLTAEQLDLLFKVIEKGGVNGIQALDDLSKGSGDTEQNMDLLQRRVGLTKDELSKLIGIVKQGGDAFVSQATDVATLVATLNGLNSEKAIREFLVQKAAVLDSGQAFLTAAENGRTLEDATKDMPTALATLTTFLSSAGSTAQHAGANFFDVGEKLNNMHVATSKEAEAAAVATKALENLATPTQLVADIAKQASASLDEMTNKLSLSEADVNFAESSGVVSAQKAIDGLQSSSERLADSVSRAKSELDRLSGQKLDLEQAKTAMEDLLQKAKAFTDGGFDITTGPGLANEKALLERIKAARDIADATFTATNDPAKAAAAYAHEIARIGTEFVNSGGNLGDLNKKLDELSARKIEFQVGLDQSTKEGLVTELAKISDTSPEVAVQIATQIDQGRLDVAGAAFDALARTGPNDKPRIAEIVASVKDADTAKKALKDLGDLVPTAVGAFDLTTAKGIDNSKKLDAALKDAHDRALLVFGPNADIAAGAKAYADRVAAIGDEFVKNGGKLDDFNAAVDARSATPIQFKVGLEEKSKAGLLNEIDTLATTHPDLAAKIRVAVNDGDLAVAQAALGAIQKDPNGANRIAAIVAAVDPTSEASTKTALDAIALEVRKAEIAASPVGQSVTRDALDQLTLDQATHLPRVAEVHVVPLGLSATRDALDALVAARNAAGLDLSPIVPGAGAPGSGGGGRRIEMGDFLQSFRSGGHLRGPNIRTAASMYTTGATPQYMWGEPSTHGEFFLSMAPQWRERNKQLHEQAGRMLYGQEYTVNARGLETVVDKLAGVVHALTPQGQRRDRAEQGQRILHMAEGAVVIKTDKPALAGRALIDELTARAM